MRRAMQCRANGQNATTATVIEHALILAGRCIARNPAQAHAGGGVCARAKSQAGVERDDFCGLGRRFMPSGYDPKFWRDLYWGELRLREAHPILIGHFREREHFRFREKILHRQRGLCAKCYIFRSKQCFQHRALPARFRRRHARLAKERLLLRRSHVSIFYTD